MRKIIPIENINILNKNYFILQINDEELALKSKPGQFFELKTAKNFPLLLRKPISIFDIEKNTISFLIKIIGKGTKFLSETKKGEMIDILGPLGNNFDIPKNKNVLLISGGIGYAPLFLLKKKLEENKNSIYWIHGGRSQNDIFDKDIINYTDDGSFGKKGLFMADLETFLVEKKINKVYSCGPKIMMKEIVKITDKNKISTEVSLESYMACGIGVCKGCSVLVKENNKKIYKTVCKDGPIFNSEKVVWDE